ncbi:hypothetical protein L202_07467 [Cryptococcus amylolentus CBS 6039]|uniref:AP complex subunit sigma n=1 Tax=Cryptococcus amylolentus CBS 6039 TaxID=1295533 RepID=A0A1E3HCA6_9TREE|nr:hypothetical protein L202_07467 [Cryptococcus amylolentus CBS 6039]ODN73972.1 hypothetical protein L202_07467 [Cryptococcus amylolentus CBS 6039]
MIKFILVQNRQGKTRLSKWYAPYDDDEKVRLRGEVHRLIAPRDQKYQSNFVEVRSSYLESAYADRRLSLVCITCFRLDWNLPLHPLPLGLPQHTQFRDDKVIYRRYAGLFFCVCVDSNDNELAYLEAIHLFVEVLDAFFQNVCELDLVFSFYKVYAILDEVFLAGEIEETSKQVVLDRLDYLEKLE